MFQKGGLPFSLVTGLEAVFTNNSIKGFHMIIIDSNFLKYCIFTGNILLKTLIIKIKKCL